MRRQYVNFRTSTAERLSSHTLWLIGFQLWTQNAYKNLRTASTTHLKRRKFSVESELAFERHFCPQMTKNNGRSNSWQKNEVWIFCLIWTWEKHLLPNAYQLQPLNNSPFGSRIYNQRSKKCHLRTRKQPHMTRLSHYITWHELASKRRKKLDEVIIYCCPIQGVPHFWSLTDWLVKRLLIIIFQLSISA